MTARILPSFLGQVEGKWYIQVDKAVNTQIEQVEGSGRELHSRYTPDTPDNPLVRHLSSEVKYLRAQLDKQTQRIAAATKQTQTCPCGWLNDETQFSNYHRPLWERVPTPDFSPSNHG